MNVGLRFLQAIRALSGALADDLQQLVAAIETSWNQQHGIEGQHTAITADSCAVAGEVSAGQLRWGARAIVDLSALMIANYIEANLMQGRSRIVIRSAGSSGGTIHGLSTVGRQDGDQVCLQNVDAQSTGGGFSVRLQATGTVPAGCATFFGEPGAPNTDVAIGQNRLVFAVLSTVDFEDGGARRWHLQML